MTPAAEIYRKGVAQSSVRTVACPVNFSTFTWVKFRSGSITVMRTFYSLFYSL